MKSRFQRCAFFRSFFHRQQNAWKSSIPRAKMLRTGRDAAITRTEARDRSSSANTATRLVADVVTGKLDVRAAAARDLPITRTDRADARTRRKRRTHRGGGTSSREHRHQREGPRNRSSCST